MEVSVQTDKKRKKFDVPENQFAEYQQKKEQQAIESALAEQQKDRKIKKLTQINRQLIQKLKQQNEDLTKKICKQKMKPGRSLSVKNSPKSNPKQIESTKKELMNAYKQIDMYKSVIHNLKAKQISIDSVDRINQLENKVKYEQGIIDELQKEIKYLGGIKQQQQKELKVFENDEVKNSVVQLEKQVATLKDKIRTMKKNAQKREEIEKKQQAYQIELERALRKLNDEYYPGKIEEKKNKQKEDDDEEITEREWQIVKSQLAELRKVHQQNGKKIDQMHRQKNREIKAAQQNDLKVKEKTRKLQTLKNKLAELTKLVTVRQSVRGRNSLKQDEFTNNKGNLSKEAKQEQMTPEQKAQKKAQSGREVKKWMIPQGYCLEKGKIMPDSIFFSDKTLLKQSKKSKIKEINIWHDPEDNPCLIQFFYEDEKSEQIEGIQPVPNISSSLELSVFTMKEGDYLHKIRGYFLGGELAGIHFISKFGRQIKVENETAVSEGELFVFEPRPNEIPSCVFGAYLRKNSDQARVCHLGFQFITDW